MQITAAIYFVFIADLSADAPNRVIGYAVLKTVIGAPGSRAIAEIAFQAKGHFSLPFL